jgi:hypothetical protein
LPIIIICAVSWLTECLVFKTTTADKHWVPSPESSISCELYYHDVICWV